MFFIELIIQPDPGNSMFFYFFARSAWAFVVFFLGGGTGSKPPLHHG